MGEVNYLTPRSHCGKQTECFFRSEIVERLHDVVGKEGRRSASPGELMIACYP